MCWQTLSLSHLREAGAHRRQLQGFQGLGFRVKCQCLADVAHLCLGDARAGGGQRRHAVMCKHADAVLEHAQDLSTLDQAMQWEVFTCITCWQLREATHFMQNLSDMLKHGHILTSLMHHMQHSVGTRLSTWEKHNTSAFISNLSKPGSRCASLAHHVAG